MGQVLVLWALLQRKRVLAGLHLQLPLHQRLLLVCGVAFDKGLHQAAHRFDRLPVSGLLLAESTKEAVPRVILWTPNSPTLNADANLGDFDALLRRGLLEHFDSEEQAVRGLCRDVLLEVLGRAERIEAGQAEQDA